MNLLLLAYASYCHCLVFNERPELIYSGGFRIFKRGLGGHPRVRIHVTEEFTRETKHFVGKRFFRIHFNNYCLKTFLVPALTSLKLAVFAMGVHMLTCELHTLVGKKRSRWWGAAVLLVVQIAWVSSKA